MSKDQCSHLVYPNMHENNKRVKILTQMVIEVAKVAKLQENNKEAKKIVSQK